MPPAAPPAAVTRRLAALRLVAARLRRSRASAAAAPPPRLVAQVLALAKQACEANKTMCLNISAPFICQVPPFRAALMEVLKFCNYVFCNESEAEELATASDPPRPSPSAGC